RKGFSPEIVEECLSSTRRLGLVDDAAFSESFVRDRVRLRPRGRRSLAGELRARGVEPETAREAIASVFLAEGVSEVELACQAAAKWSPRAGEDPRKARARLQGLLVRRGFTSDAVREAARSRLAELGTDAEEHSL
ncbi:MAG: RecX family transcriptional regulator, partial [Gemmatimonadota bacterium]|nr:RecX family transcriptional regulator [Gemmatimonadota bacterium]